MTLIAELEEDVIEMGRLVKETISKASRAFLLGDPGLAAEVIEEGVIIDSTDSTITSRCLDMLTSGQGLPVEHQVELTALLSLTKEIERIGDMAEGIALICRETCSPYPAPIAEQVQQMADSTFRSVEIGLPAFLYGSPQGLYQLRWERDLVEVADRRLHAEVQRSLRSVPDHLRTSVWLLFVSQNLRRMADYAANIGAWAVAAPTSGNGRRSRTIVPSHHSGLLFSDC